MLARGAIILILAALITPALAQAPQGAGRGPAPTQTQPPAARQPTPPPAARPAPVPVAREVEPFLGTWRIGAPIARARYAIMTPPVQASLTGREVTLTAELVVTWIARETAAEERCDQPGFEVRQNTRARVVGDYRMAAEELRVLPENFAELTVMCRGNHIVTLRQIDGAVGMIDIDGVFFRLERVARVAAPQPPGPAATPRPSFDCAAARAADERIICGDVALAAADRNMAETFGRVVAALPEPQREAVRREQRDWLTRRARACNLQGDPKIDATTRPGFVACLTQLYAARQRQLEERLPKPAGR